MQQDVLIENGVCNQDVQKLELEQVRQL